MRKVSLKRQQQQKEYSALRKEWLKDKVCEVCYNVRAAEVHHMEGRSGDKYLDKTDWLPICRNCHERVTRDSKWAIEQGYSKRRNT